MLLNVNNTTYKSSDINGLKIFNWDKSSRNPYGLNVYFATGYEQLTFNTSEERQKYYDFYAGVLEKEEAKKHGDGNFVCKYCGAPNEIK
jgi:hypothetical protein